MKKKYRRGAKKAHKTKTKTKTKIRRLRRTRRTRITRSKQGGNNKSYPTVYGPKLGSDAVLTKILTARELSNYFNESS